MTPIQRRWLPLILFALLVVGGVGIAWWQSQETTTSPARPPQENRPEKGSPDGAGQQGGTSHSEGLRPDGAEEPSVDPQGGQPTGDSTGRPSTRLADSDLTPIELEQLLPGTPGTGRVVGTISEPLGFPLDDVTVYLYQLPRPEGRQQSRFRLPEYTPATDFASAGPLTKARTLSNAYGEFELVAEPGSYTLAAEKDGWARGSARVTVEAERETRKDLRLSQEAFIFGRVTDSEGTPVEGATIDAFAGFGESRSPSGGKSAPDGTYLVGNLVPGNYFVVVNAKGYAPAFRGNVRATSEGVDVQLQPGAEVFGRLVDKETGEGIPDASIRLQGGGRRAFVQTWLARVETDVDGEEGAFVIQPLRPGEIELRVDAPGYAAREAGPFQVPHEGELKIELESGGQVTGRVVDKDGQGIEGATVVRRQSQEGFMAMITPSSPEMLATGTPEGERAVTDGSGRYTLTNVPQGTHPVLALAQGYQLGRTTVDVEVNEEADAPDLVLPTGARIYGVVELAGDEEPQGVSVVANGPAGMMWAQLDEEGAFALEGLGSGQYTVSANRGFRPLVSQTVQLAEGEEKEVILEVSAGATLRGTVTRGGVAAPEVDVQLFKKGEGFGGLREQSDEHGRYQLEAVPPGTYNVFADGVRVKDTYTVPQDVDVLTLDLTIPSGTLVGRVVDGATGTPLHRAQLVVRLAPDEMPGDEEGIFAGYSARGSTDEEGYFELTGLAPRRYLFTVTHDGHSRLDLPPFQLEAGQRELGTLEMLPGLTLKGWVRDDQDRSVPDAQVYLSDPVTGDRVSGNPFGTRTDEEGSFTAEELKQGPLLVSASIPGSAPTTVAVMVSQDGQEITVLLKAPAGLELSVVDGSGAPVAGAIVTLRHADGYPVRMPLLGDALVEDGPTDARGRFVRGALPAGSYLVALVPPSGGAPTEATLQLQEGVTLKATLALGAEGQ